jgi:long-chain acyl-CoA synthetase
VRKSVAAHFRMQTFYNRFLRSVERYPSHIAVELQLADPEAVVVSHTYAELRQMAESVGSWLRDFCTPSGARCAILGANSPNWVAAYLGSLSVGAIPVPLDTSFKPEQVAKLLLDSGSALLFADDRHRDVAKQAIAMTGAKVQMVLLSGEGEGDPTLRAMFAAGPTPDFSPIDARPDDTAVILYTSGTTSDPKGVMLTHANMDAEAEAVFGFIRIDETDAILGVLPLFHALAQMANLLLPYSAGTRVVYLEQLNTTELLRGLRDRNITLFCCVPQFFYLIHEKVMRQVKERSGLGRVVFQILMFLSRFGRSVGVNPGKVFFAKAHAALGQKMRYLITGGSRFDPSIGRDLETLGFDILQAYGLTECCGGATVTELRTRFNGSVGKPLAGVEVKILDPKPEGGAMTGEVAIRGPIVMKGYYNRPEATTDVLKEGWLHTGDLGHLDAGGNLFITGRQKDVIVLSSGKNIYPEEIETHYAQSSWIKEICVLGLQSAPGEPFAERLHAVIVPDLEILREKRIVNMKEVVRFDVENLSAKLPSTKRILSYDIWQEDLPRTTTRKLKRFAIQKLVQERHARQQRGEIAIAARELSEHDREWSLEPEVERALNVIRKAAKKLDRGQELHPKDNLELDLGLDSMQRVELVVALEQELGAKADENMISEVYTVRELVDTVRAGIGASGARLKAGWDEVFATEATEPEIVAVAENRPVASRLWFVFGRFVKWFVCRLLFRMEISGLEKLPRSGPFILCPNHQSFIDAPLLVSFFPYRLYRDLFYVGTSEIFGSGPMRRLAKSLKLVPVDPDANLVPAMRAGSYGLKRGKILVLYPEGERSIDGEPKLFKKGAAILAVHHDVPIYPVAIEGFHDAWPRGEGFQGFHKLRAAIGDPIYPPKDAASPDEAYEVVNRRLKQAVMDMWLPLHQKNTRHESTAAAAH